MPAPGVFSLALPPLLNFADDLANDAGRRRLTSPDPPRLPFRDPPCIPITTFSLGALRRETSLACVRVNFLLDRTQIETWSWGKS